MSFSRVTLLSLLFFSVFSTPQLAQVRDLSLNSLLKPLRVPTTSQQQVTKRKVNNEKEIVHSIQIIGNKHIPKKLITKEILLKKGDELNPYRIKLTVKNIQSMGYFKTVKSQVKKTSKGPTIQFIVEENPILSTINFEGANLYDKKTMLSLITSKENELYNLSSIRKDIQAIENHYHENGYSQAKVYRVIHPKKEGDSLTFYVGEGIIEELRITGNTKTQDYVILRELEIEPGMAIHDETLKKNLRRIYNLNYFTDIIPKFIPAEKPNTYILELELKERDNNGSVSFGGGYSPQSGFSLFSDLYWDNIFGTGQLIMLKGNFGLGSSTSKEKVTTYQFKYHNPWAWDYRRSFTFRTWLTNGAIGSINPLNSVYTYRDEQRKGFDTTFGMYHTYEFRSSHTFKYESIILKDSSNRWYNIYSYALGLSYDDRDIRHNPSEGRFHSLRIEQSFKFRERAINFTKFDLTLRKFIPTFKKQTIALRSEFGALASPDINDSEVFQSEWYFVGGGSSVRGYEDQAPFASGTKRVLANIEYRFLFTDIFQLITFIDAGTASSSEVEALSLSQYKIGKGIGLRFNVPPLGPIRLDFGIDEKGESRIHFNVGHTF